MNLPTSIVAYMFLFAGVGFAFLFVNLLLGRFLRPYAPNQEKLEVYECGEPTIGSSFVQFDLRFYVVALLFLIFDVEVAFFFPWATVFGKSTALMDERLPPAAVRDVYQELGVKSPDPGVLADTPEAKTQRVAEAKKLALMSLADIGAFFAVLLVGFAYVWRRGDLDWVRAVSEERSQAQSAERPQLTLVG
jgi:NADH-quinone oxidoreductase subunit A